MHNKAIKTDVSDYDAMTYHHVIAKVGSEDKYRSLFLDLSASELSEKFLTPYEKGVAFFSGNDLISPSELRSVQIIRTERNEEAERDELNRISLAQIDEINRSGSVTFISAGSGYFPEDIADAGEDVTRALIKGPPGHKAGRWAPSLLVFGWIAGIAATVAAAGLVHWLGWV